MTAPKDPKKSWGAELERRVDNIDSCGAALVERVDDIETLTNKCVDAHSKGLGELKDDVRMLARAALADKAGARGDLVTLENQVKALVRRIDKARTWAAGVNVDLARRQETQDSLVASAADAVEAIENLHERDNLLARVAVDRDTSLRKRFGDLATSQINLSKRLAKVEARAHEHRVHLPSLADIREMVEAAVFDERARHEPEWSREKIADIAREVTQKQTFELIQLERRTRESRFLERRAKRNDAIIESAKRVGRVVVAVLSILGVALLVSIFAA